LIFVWIVTNLVPACKTMKFLVAKAPKSFTKIAQRLMINFLLFIFIVCL